MSRSAISDTEPGHGPGEGHRDGHSTSDQAVAAAAAVVAAAVAAATVARAVGTAARGPRPGSLSPDSLPVGLVTVSESRGSESGPTRARESRRPRPGPGTGNYAIRKSFQELFWKCKSI